MKLVARPFALVQLAVCVFGVAVWAGGPAWAGEGRFGGNMRQYASSQPAGARWADANNRPGGGHWAGAGSRPGSGQWAGSSSRPAIIRRADANSPLGGARRAEAYERHVEMRNALFHLQEARREMERAAHDFDGHRAAALKITDQAIKEIAEGLKDGGK